MFIKTISGSQHCDHGRSLSRSQQNSYMPHQSKHVLAKKTQPQISQPPLQKAMHIGPLSNLV